MRKSIILFLIALLVITSCTQKEVELKITSIAFDSTQVVIGVSESTTLTLKQTPANLPATVLTWVSLSPDIATVDANGVVKGVSIGTAKIKVSSQSDQSINANCNIIVKTKGTSDLPYLIFTVQDLIQMRDRVNNDNANYGNKVYKLMADLDFSNEASWLPIGSSNNTPFTGIFDGNSKIIKNIRIGTPNSSVSLINSGLFGIVSGGDILNLAVQGTFISTTNNSGGIVGYLSGGTVTNCNSTGNIISSGTTGGIVGGVTNSIITNCYSTGNITSTSGSSGGIAGSGGTITNCHTTGKITSTSGSSGGITGSGGTISNCYSTGDVTFTSSANESGAGGITGSLGGTIINCYSIGNISSNSSGSSSYSGGITGSGGTITNCYSTGNITSTSNCYSISGGIVGNTFGTITNCYSTGNISSNSSGSSSYSGGIVGNTFGTVKNCIAMNSSINSIYYNYPYSNNLCYAYRVGANITTSSYNNYAASTIIVKKGTSSSNLTTVTSFTNAITDGVNMTGNPLDLLNAYVIANPTFNGITLSKWKVDASVNNGKPIFQ